MLYSEIIAVCSEVNTKHPIILWAECTFFECLNLLMHQVTTRL
jgi:hypothetical protein